MRPNYSFFKFLEKKKKKKSNQRKNFVNKSRGFEEPWKLKIEPNIMECKRILGM